MKTLTDVLGDTTLFVASILEKVNNIDLDIRGLTIDHICYRVETDERYSLKKTELLEFGTLLAESNVNGRLISTFKLRDPIEYQTYKIHLVELPAPKEEKSYTEGLEHLEFVTKSELNKIVRMYPQLAFDTYGMNKKINADITLKLGAYSIRFHNHSLEDVIKKESSPIHHHQHKKPHGKPFKKNHGRTNQYKK